MAKGEIAEPATADIQEAFNWWSENRSAIQAAEWYERIFEAITAIERMPASIGIRFVACRSTSP